MQKKTPSYTREAIDRYQAQFDILRVRTPKGSRDRLRAVGLSSAACADLILAELERREAERGGVS